MPSKRNKGNKAAQKLRAKARHKEEQVPLKWSNPNKKKWGASTWAGAQGGQGKNAQKLLESKLKAGDIPGALAAAKRFVATGNTGGITKLLPGLLELAARKAGPAQYGEVLGLSVQVGVKLDVLTFTKLLVILVSRIPVPTGMVRLTLNMGLPKDGQIIPLIPANATEEEERAVLEDGEPEPVDRLRQAPPSAPAKEAGPQPETAAASELQEARAALLKVQPTELRGRVQVNDAATAAYFGHFVALLHLETLVELRALKQRLNRPPENLEQYGWMVRELQVLQAETRSVGKSKGGNLPGREPGTKRARVVFVLPGGTDVTRLRLKSGDSVLLSRQDPLVDFVGEGIVADAPNAEEDIRVRQGWEQRIVVQFDASLDERTMMQGRWRLDKAANRTAYERQFLALLKLVTAKEEKRRTLWDMLPLTGVGGSNVDAWAAKMRKMLDDQQMASLDGAGAATSNSSTGKGGSSSSISQGDRPTLAVQAKGGGKISEGGHRTPAELKLQRMAAEELSMQDPGALHRARRSLQARAWDLNASQRAAVGAALGRRLTLVQGPPGTGKTTVSVRLLGLWAQQMRARPLLATSDSNIAVDNIAEGAHGLGLKVVRVGRPEKVTSNLEGITLESILRQRLEEKAKAEEDYRGKSDSGPQDAETGDLDSWEDTGSAKGSGKGSAKGSAKGSGKFLDAEAQKQRRVDEFEAKMAILREADVVCTTTIAAGTEFLHLQKFQAILIDEVAQATELSAIVPIVLRGTERLVLVGDHCQLPPSVCSLEAETRGLSLSIFGRLIGGGIEPYFLDTQFRMHPMIAQFSAQEFYHGKLKTGVDGADRPPPEGFNWPQQDSGIAFCHVDALERRDGESRVNSAEVSAVLDILVSVLAAKELSVLDIGIVSPYSAQVRALRQALRRELPQRLQGMDVDLTGGLQGRAGARALEIASVDAFQGREKELIIFSAVRSNNFGNVGFLADWRRLNVMITRSRRGLIIVGNTSTLRSDETWAKWLDWADDSGLVVDGESGAARTPVLDRRGASIFKQKAAARPAVPSQAPTVAPPRVPLRATAKFRSHASAMPTMGSSPQNLWSSMREKAGGHGELDEAEASAAGTITPGESTDLDSIADNMLPQKPYPYTRAWSGGKAAAPKIAAQTKLQGSNLAALPAVASWQTRHMNGPTIAANGSCGGRQAPPLMPAATVVRPSTLGRKGLGWQRGGKPGCGKGFPAV